MIDSIEIKIAGDKLAAARFQSKGQQIRQDLLGAMKRQWLALQAYVVTNKLSGDPLHRRTGVLASSINVGAPETATAFEESPMLLVGRVGTRVWYGKVHEEGGTFEIKAHTRTSRLGKQFPVRAHPATFPQRSFLRSSLRDLSSQIRESFARAVAESIREG